MENNLENLTIGVFAKAAGVNVETIRFYQRKGLLLEPDKPYGSIRRYGEADVTRVRFVKSAQRLGFSLDEIAELLRLEDGTHCEEASSLAEHKLKDVREKMADLARMEAVLSELVCACHARRGNVSCPLIASLQGWSKLGRFGYALACFIFRFLRRPRHGSQSGHTGCHRALSVNSVRSQVCNGARKGLSEKDGGCFWEHFSVRAATRCEYHKHLRATWEPARIRPEIAHKRKSNNE